MLNLCDVGDLTQGSVHARQELYRLSPILSLVLLF